MGEFANFVAQQMSNFNPETVGKVVGTPEQAKALPMTDQIWIVSFDIDFKTDIVETIAQCNLVHDNTASMILSFILEETNGGVSPDYETQQMFGAVVSACNKPFTMGTTPCRPKQVLFVTAAAEKRMKKVNK